MVMKTKKKCVYFKSMTLSYADLLEEKKTISSHSALKLYYHQHKFQGTDIEIKLMHAR